MGRSKVAALCAVLLAACGGGATGSGTSPVAVVEVVQDVQHYHACGNEVLELPDGRRWWPLIDQDEVDPAGYPLPSDAAPSQDEAAAGLVVAAVLAVPAPGPGDDTGTLTVFEDGVAHWRSDSGITAWMIDEEIVYNWVC